MSRIQLELNGRQHRHTGLTVQVADATIKEVEDAKKKAAEDSQKLQKELDTCMQELNKVLEDRYQLQVMSLPCQLGLLHDTNTSESAAAAALLASAAGLVRDLVHIYQDAQVLHMDAALARWVDVVLSCWWNKRRELLLGCAAAMHRLHANWASTQRTPGGRSEWDCGRR
jgi:phage gp36-like protein